MTSNPLPEISDSMEPNPPDSAELHSVDGTLKKIAQSWSSRAAVKKPDLDGDALFNPQLPDFLETLLPFSDHPYYLEAPDYHARILSCGWLAYNEKTIQIEGKVIMPACLHLIHDEVPGLNAVDCRRLVSQTLTDEAYHILMIEEACRITRQRRDLEGLRLPPFDLIRRMEREKARQSESWQRILVQVACAVISEISISDYLKLLADATAIQPLNSLVTQVHRKDELAHSGIFKKLTKLIYHGLDARGKTFLLQALAKPLSWFASLELDVWQSVLEQIGFPRAEAMITELKQRAHFDLGLRDFSGLEQLLPEIDLEMDGCFF